MAKLNGDFGITGGAGNLSFYKMRGVDQPIVRTKGGPSKHKIKNSPRFEGTRRVMSEFGGRAAASKWIMQALWLQKALADYNIAGPLNALLKPVQVLDTDSLSGQRNVLLSRNPYLLKGFSLNRKQPFDSVIRCPLDYSLSRKDLSARIEIPELLPGIHLFTGGSQPLYSVQALLGIVPDLFYHPYGYTSLPMKLIITGGTRRLLPTGFPYRKDRPLLHWISGWMCCLPMSHLHCCCLLAYGMAHSAIRIPSCRCLIQGAPRYWRWGNL